MKGGCIDKYFIYLSYKIYMVRKVKKLNTKIKEKREKKRIKLELEKRKKEILEKDIFIKIYENLNDFISKSSIKTFKKYLVKFSEKKNWTLISDYSFYNKKDKNNAKKSNVYSYVLIPYFIDQNFIEKTSKSIKKDIKKVKKIPIETIHALKNNSFFIFNFITEKDYLDDFFKKNKFDSSTQKKDLKILIDAYEKLYKDNSLKQVVNEVYKHLDSKLEEKSFNSSLYQKIYLNSFFAAFISIILEREIKIENFSWISDRDPMFSFIDKLPQIMYYFRRGQIKEIESVNHREINHFFHSIPEAEKPFYDPLISYPDYFAGTLAEYEIDNLKSFDENNKEKYKQMIEDVLKNNENCINIVLKNKHLEIYRLMISENRNILSNSTKKK